MVESKDKIDPYIRASKLHKLRRKTGGKRLNPFLSCKEQPHTVQLVCAPKNSCSEGSWGPGFQESRNFKKTTRNYETEIRKPKKEESSMLMRNVALVKVMRRKATEYYWRRNRPTNWHQLSDQHLFVYWKRPGTVLLLTPLKGSNIKEIPLMWRNLLREMVRLRETLHLTLMTST